MYVQLSFTSCMRPSSMELCVCVWVCTHVYVCVCVCVHVLDAWFWLITFPASLGSVRQQWTTHPHWQEAAAVCFNQGALLTCICFLFLRLTIFTNSIYCSLSFRRPYHTWCWDSCGRSEQWGSGWALSQEESLSAHTWTGPKTALGVMWGKSCLHWTLNSWLECVCVWCLQVVSDVVVRDTHQLSPTVRGFTLCVQNNSLSFKSGQWWVGLDQICLAKFEQNG